MKTSDNPCPRQTFPDPSVITLPTIYRHGRIRKHSIYAYVI